jgi:hypothetical protein
MGHDDNTPEDHRVIQIYSKNNFEQRGGNVSVAGTDLNQVLHAQTSEQWHAKPYERSNDPPRLKAYRVAD